MSVPGRFAHSWVSLYFYGHHAAQTRTESRRKEEEPHPSHFQTPPPDFPSMSVGELKSYIRERGGNPHGLVERSELIDLAKTLRR